MCKHDGVVATTVSGSAVVVTAVLGADVDATWLPSPQLMIVNAKNALPMHRLARAVAWMSIAVFYRD